MKTEKTKQEQKLKSILKEKDELFVKIQNLVNKFEKKTKTKVMFEHKQGKNQIFLIIDVDNL